MRKTGGLWGIGPNPDYILAKTRFKSEKGKIIYDSAKKIIEY